MIRSISGRGQTFVEDTQNPKIMLTYLYGNEKNAIAVNQLGYQQESKAYCFADATIPHDNKLFYPDKLGIVNQGKTVCYLSSFVYTNYDNKSNSSQQKFTYEARNRNFKEWLELSYKAYGINGAIGISFIILALYPEIILELTGFFPLLFLFGD